MQPASTPEQIVSHRIASLEQTEHTPGRPLRMSWMFLSAGALMASLQLTAVWNPLKGMDTGVQTAEAEPVSITVQRRLQAAKAVEALRSQLSQLDEARKQGSLSAEWKAGFRSTLETIRGDYLLFGNVDASRPEPAVEDALRTSFLYLSTMGQLSGVDQAQQDREYQRLHQQLEASLASIPTR